MLTALLPTVIAATTPVSVPRGLVVPILAIAKSVCAEATMAESPPPPRSLEHSDAPRVDGPPNPPPLSMDPR